MANSTNVGIIQDYPVTKKAGFAPDANEYMPLGYRSVIAKMSEWTHEDFEDMRKDWGNSTLVGWKLFYTDGSTVTSEEMPFNDAPQDSVQALKKYYKRAKGGYSREVQNGLDLYVLYSDQAEKLDLPPEIKKGQNLPNRVFQEILTAARADEEIVTEMI